MLKFTERPKKLGITFKKTWLSLKGIGYLQLISVLIWRNKRWYDSIYKEKELGMDFLTSRILLQKVCSYKCQFCTKESMCIFKTCCRELSRYVMVGQNIEKKFIQYHIPIKMLKKGNSKLIHSQLYSSNGCRKTR